MMIILVLVIFHLRNIQDKQSDLAVEVENDNWDNHANQRLSTALVTLDERSQDIIKIGRAHV